MHLNSTSTDWGQAKSYFLVLVLLSGSAPSMMAQSSGTFIAAGLMTAARSRHTATMLADGRVLLAGGAIGGTLLASAEIYEPSTGTFTPTGNMNAARAAHIATLLADGRVLIFEGEYFASIGAELYDPSSGTFSTTGNGTTPLGRSAALLKNGKVLIVDDPGPLGALTYAQLYDPDTGTFVPTGTYASLDMAQLDHAMFPSYGGSNAPRATPLADGRVLVVGGAFAELYDPDTGTFSVTGTKITLSNGFVKTVPAQWYDPADATLLPNGTVLFSGGDDNLGPSAAAWIYDPSNGTFTATGSMTTPRETDTVTLLPNGDVLLAGSFAPGEFISVPLPPRADPSAEVYDPGAGAFSVAPNMTVARYGHTATLLNNGRVLIAGGTTGDYPGYQYLASTEFYTPPVLAPGPALFPVSGNGGQGAIWHAQTGQIASPSNPARAGEALSMYASGLIEGGVAPPQVVVGGRIAEILFFGDAPGYPGLYQVNFRVPAGVAPGPAASVRLTYLNRPSNQVTIGLQ